MRWIKGNVERVTNSNLLAQKLEAEGYKRLDCPSGAADPADGGPDKPLEEMNADELRAYAKEKGIGGYYSLNKAELLEALKGVS